MKKITICLFLIFAVSTASAFDLSKSFKKVSDTLGKSTHKKHEQTEPSIDSSHTKKEPTPTPTQQKKKKTTMKESKIGVNIEKACLGGVCLGDSIVDLQKITWIASHKMELKNRDKLKLPSTGIGIFESCKVYMNEYGYSKSEEEFIKKYILGLTEEERILLTPYYKAHFFDNKVLGILNKVIACKGKKMCGFVQTKSGNLDKISVMPSPTTGKYEVVSIERQFTKMDKTEKGKIFKALQSKYPSIMSRTDARRVAYGKKEWDESMAIISWDQSYGRLILSKVLKYGNGQINQAVDLHGDFNDKALLKIPCCDEALTPTLDID